MNILNYFSDSDMDTYYQIPVSPSLVPDANASNGKQFEVNSEKNDITLAPLHDSGASPKPKTSTIITSGFSSCKDLSPKHSTNKPVLDMSASQSGCRSTAELSSNCTTTSILNSNFLPACSFESESLVRQSLNSANSSSKIQSHSNHNGSTSGQLPGLPSYSDTAVATTTSFAIPQLKFQSYFSKTNTPSFLSDNSTQPKTLGVAEEGKYKKERKSSRSSSSPYTFFQMDSDDDFDFDVVDDINNASGDQDMRIGGCSIGLNDTDDDELEDLGAGHSRWYSGAAESQNERLISGSVNPGENQGCLSQSSSIISMPACRICQLPSMEPANHLISPCRCLGSIRYVHNNCLLVSKYIIFPLCNKLQV